MKVATTDIQQQEADRLWKIELKKMELDPDYIPEIIDPEDLKVARSDNSYAQLIDDFDAGIQVLEGETLTEYIKRMGGVDYNAHGGSVGIEVLFKKKDGGRSRFISNGGWSWWPYKGGYRGN